MENRKVLRISTIVLAMAVFSLVIAKPGMAYARSESLGHLLHGLGPLGHLTDLLGLHVDEKGRVHGLVAAGIGAGGAAIGTTLGGAPWGTLVGGHVGGQAGKNSNFAIF
jgi:hypothetical protein